MLNSTAGSIECFNIFTRFCYGAISETILSIAGNITQTSTRMEIITVDITPAA